MHRTPKRPLNPEAPKFASEACRAARVTRGCTNWRVARSDYDQRLKVLKAVQNRLTNDHSVGIRAFSGDELIGHDLTHGGSEAFRNLGVAANVSI